MFGRYKTEVIDFKEFMGRKEGKENFPHPSTKCLNVTTSSHFQLSRKQATKLIIVTGAILLSIGFGDPTFAAAGAVNGAITQKVVNAFDPLIQLVQSLSYPIGLTMMLGGGLYVMIGNSDRGLGMIQKAGVGYILIQMLPILMDLLVEIAKAL
ncbi:MULTISPECIES: hypothetical protein [Bacillus]|uniref:hypothetical protein n=1 Tax=Bacillus TaxID=1386 RepID=UPI0002D30008|nr:MULTISPECIES: hypothetical protein [Bacillus]